MNEDLGSLLPHGERMSDELRARLQTAARAAPTAFLTFVTTSGEDDDDNYARGHAADLLADIGAVECIPALLETIADWECPELLWSYLRKSLPRFGAAIIEPALAIMTRPQTSIAGDCLCDVLVMQGTRDPRIFDALCGYFAKEPTGARFFVEYGDARAIPILQAAILSFAPDIIQSDEIDAIEEIERAIEQLGGVIDDESRACVERWKCEATATRVAFARTRPEFPEAIEDKAAWRKAILENRPSLDIVRFAEPLLAKIPSWRGEDLNGVVSAAEAIERLALIGDGSTREAAIARFVALLPTDDASRQVVAEMIPRYDAMFPGRRVNTPSPKGEPS